MGLDLFMGRNKDNSSRQGYCGFTDCDFPSLPSHCYVSGLFILTCLSGWKIVCLLSVYEALKRELL